MQHVHIETEEMSYSNADNLLHAVKSFYVDPWQVDLNSH